MSPQGYTIKYRCRDCLRDGWKYDYLSNINRTTYQFYASPGSTYDTWVKVYTSRGSGQYSQSSCQLPALAIQIRNLTYSATGKQVAFRWSPTSVKDILVRNQHRTPQ